MDNLFRPCGLAAALLASLLSTPSMGLSFGNSHQNVGALQSLFRRSRPKHKVGLLHWPRIMVTYVNVEGSINRENCMEKQLATLTEEATSMGIYLSFERAKAETLSTCANVSSCMQEKPECFPSGSLGFIHHGHDDDAERVNLIAKGVLGNWCSHVRLLRKLHAADKLWDYFLILEDDVMFKPGFLNQLLTFLRNFPHQWTLVALDTFSARSFPEDDEFTRNASQGLNLRAMSATRNTYWGAHAWLIHSHKVAKFLELFEKTPAIPIDWITKTSHPLHMGMWNFQTDTIKQLQHVTSEEIGLIPAECASVAGSDIDNGGTVSEPVASPVPTKMSVAMARDDPVDASSSREALILGMFDSGTQLVNQLIKRHLEIPNDLELCKERTASHCGRIWMHTHPSRIAEAAALREGLPALKNAVAVVVVRHPFGTLRSFQRRQRPEFVDCDVSGVGAFVESCDYTEPKDGIPRVPRALCAADVSEDAINSSAGRDTADAAAQAGNSSSRTSCWPNYPEAWNSYMASIRNLSTVVGRVVTVRYEDLVEDPNNALRRIAHALHLAMPTNVAHVVEAIPGPGPRQDHAGALAKLQQPDYEGHYNCGEMSMLCSRLDPGLLFQQGYHACQKSWMGFQELIYHGSAYHKNPKLVWEMEGWPEWLGCTNDVE